MSEQAALTFSATPQLGGVTTCRACREGHLRMVLSLGEQPRSNAFLLPEHLSHPEPRYPLELAICPVCSLVQVTQDTPPEEVFRNYPYFSSNAETMVAHSAALVRRLVAERQLGSSDLVIEVASNDGYLLQHYQRLGIPVLGIDPAQNVVDVALARGVPTLCSFFGPELAEELRADGRRGAIVHANNVLAHVPDVNGFVRGLARVVADDGLVVIETPYVRELVDRLEFDTIYHEHLFYYSVTSLRSLLERNGLTMVSIEPVDIHGGSLRILAVASPAQPDPTVEALATEEERIGLSGLSYYERFADDVAHHVTDVRRLLGSLVANGRRIAAYGAAAKGTVLLNTLDVGIETIEFTVDLSPHKQGRLIPGVHIPIVPPDRLLQVVPDDVILLAWNFADEIIAQQQEYLRRGGRFILPTPGLRTVV